MTLGGKRAIMVYTGVAHAPDSSAIYFPDERTVFGADTLQVRRLPGGLAPSVGAWIDTDMSAGVAAEVAAGRSLPETQKRVTLAAYKGWDRYDTNLQGHIAQVYGILKGTR